MEYKASYDNKAKLVTIGVVILMGWIAFSRATGNDFSLLFNFVPGLIGLVVLGGTYIFSPQGYEISDTQLILKRLISNIKIDLNEITEVKNVGSMNVFRTIRTFGSGGLFGYFGQYYNRDIGSHIVYATKTTDLILITTKTGKKYVITPDDLGMADELKKRAGIE